MLRTQAIKGYRPWYSPDAGTPLRHIDPHKQKIIDLCAEHCPYAEAEDCCNCLGRKRAGRGEVPEGNEVGNCQRFGERDKYP